MDVHLVVVSFYRLSYFFGDIAMMIVLKPDVLSLEKNVFMVFASSSRSAISLFFSLIRSTMFSHPSNLIHMELIFLV